MKNSEVVIKSSPPYLDTLEKTLNKIWMKLLVPTKLVLSL